MVGYIQTQSQVCVGCKGTQTLTDVSPLFSSLCLLLHRQKESQQKEAAQVQRRHERKKEKRKKSAKLQLHIQEQNLEPVQGQAGPTGQTEDTHVQPPPREPPPDQTEKPQKTVIQTEPKARTSNSHLRLIQHKVL